MSPHQARRPQPRRRHRPARGAGRRTRVTRSGVVVAAAGLAVVLGAGGCASDRVKTFVVTEPDHAVSSPSPDPDSASGDAPLPAVDPAGYLAANGSYYFSSPSGKWLCGIVTAPEARSAGCHGPFPASLSVTQADSPYRDGRPNAVWLRPGAPADFIVAGNPMFQPLDGSVPPALPYGHSLSADEFTCSIDITAGVTCGDRSGHGFTVSDNSGEVH